MIGNKIEQDLQAQFMRMRHESVEVIERPEHRRDGAIVGDVVAEVDHWRRVDRRDPYGVHAKRSEVLQARRDARKIADAVAVCVLKRTRVDLVNHASLPPRQF
jgi:hypothetical protein